ncbi:MAG TPA: hypothetical protein ENI85_19180 [Deltaproteobacteria bacterium]|nr:hypothetical protein [Deltaproteobacteria bacterium]
MPRRPRASRRRRRPHRASKPRIRSGRRKGSVRNALPGSRFPRWSSTSPTSSIRRRGMERSSRPWISKSRRRRRCSASGSGKKCALRGISSSTNSSGSRRNGSPRDERMSTPLSQAEKTSILEALSSADEEVRRLAVEQLLLLPIHEAAEQLHECLGDSGWRVRKAAVERLVACGGQAPVQEMLLNSLADGENPGRRNSAFEALVGCGSRATARLIQELGNADPDVRKLVIDALAAIGDATARGPLAEVVEDPDPNVRAAATEALGVVGGEPEIERLTAIACDVEEEILVRLSGLRALIRLEADVRVARFSSALDDPLLCPAAFELLGYSQDPSALDVLLKALSRRGRSARHGAMGALLRQLGNRDDRAADDLRAEIRDVVRAIPGFIETLAGQIESADLGSRMVAVQFLGLLDDDRVVLPILLAGRDEAIEELADRTLETMGERVGRMLEHVWHDLEPDVEARACGLLGRVGGECADRLLAGALDSIDAEVRRRAARAVAEGGFFDRVPDLVRRLESAARHDDCESAEEIETVVSAIVQLADAAGKATSRIRERLIETLTGRLEGAPEPVRLAIGRVLARIGRAEDEATIALLLKDESPLVRREAVHALERFDLERMLETIRLCLADESAAVRIAAAKVLGGSRRASAMRELSVLMSDEDPRVVAVAVRSMGRLGRDVDGVTEEVSQRIEEAIRADPVVALAALDALREIGGSKAGEIACVALERPEADVVRAAVGSLGIHASRTELDGLVPLIAHPDWSVRAAVAEVLAARGHRKSLPALLRRLEVEDDAFVREAMLRSIGRLEG